MKNIVSLVLLIFLFTNCSKEEKIDRSIPIPNDKYVVPLLGKFIDRDLSEFVEIPEQNLELKISIDSTDKPNYFYVLETEIELDFISSKVFNAELFRPAFSLIFLNKNNEKINHDLYLSHTHISDELRKQLGKAKGKIKIPIKIFSTDINFSSDNSDQEIIYSQKEAYKIIYQLEQFKTAALECELIVQDEAKRQIVKKDSNGEDKLNNEEILSDNSDEKELSDCDQFLKGYEKFVLDYIDILEKMKKNPTDMELLTKASQLQIDATEWADKIADCQNDPTFYIKYMELYTKLLRAL